MKAHRLLRMFSRILVYSCSARSAHASALRSAKRAGSPIRCSFRAQERQHIRLEETRPIGAVVAASVPRPFDFRVPWVLAQLGVERRVCRASNNGRETVLPRRFSTAPIGSAHNLHRQAERQAIPVAAKHVDAAASGAQGRAQIVVRAHRRCQQDDAVDAVRREHFCCGENHGAASAVPDQVDPSMGALLAIRRHLGSEPAPLGTVVGVIRVVGQKPPAAVGPDKGLDLQRRARLGYHFAETHRGNAKVAGAVGDEYDSDGA